MGNLCCCVQVDQSKVSIAERFGKFQEVLEPGCHCRPWFLGSRLAGHLSLRLQQLDVKCETKTKDNVFVNVVASVQYRALAHKANAAFYKLTNTKLQIQAYVFDGKNQKLDVTYTICYEEPLACLLKIFSDHLQAIVVAIDD